MNESLSEDERSKLAVWDYPISDRYTKMWAQMQEVTLPSSFEEALGKVKSSNPGGPGFALIGEISCKLLLKINPKRILIKLNYNLAEAPNVEYASLLNCDVHMVGQAFAPRPIALGLKKNSPLKSKLNLVIERLFNNGTIQKIKDKYWVENDKRVSCNEYRRMNDGIPLRNSGGIFYIIVLGVSVTGLTLIVENIYFRGKKRGKATTTKNFLSLLIKKISFQK